MRRNRHHGVDRRQFLASSAAALAGATATSSATFADRRRAANDRIQVGVVGLGSRGYNLADSLIGRSDQARIVAICDVDVMHYRDRPWGTGTAHGLIPAEEKIKAGYAKRGVRNLQLAKVSDYRDLVARDDVDAVVVATPDHWHALCTLDALRAGKDVYCEKPVTHFFAEGQFVYREVAEQKAVFQTGSQQRSGWEFRRAVELVRNGHLGEIKQIQVGLPPGYSEPQGDTRIGKIPKQLDYDFWCGPAPLLPYMRARHHRWWRGHRAFGGGVLMDWIGHHNDIGHWAIGVDQGGPHRVETLEWVMPEADVYDTPHQYTIRCEYDGGIIGTISSRNEKGLRLVGSDGWVHVNRGKLLASDERWVARDFDPGPLRVYRSDDHMANFLECIGSRKECVAPAETAHRSITPGHLGYVSHAVGRPLQWDAKTESVVDDAEADELLRRMPYREPWSV